MQKHGITEAQAEFIFALIDPRDSNPFYIGRTFRSAESGFHVDRPPATDVAARLSDKMAQICAMGLSPRWVLLEETTNGEDDEAEWVRHWISQGSNLVNDPPPARQLKALTLRLPEPEYQMLREFAYKNDKTYQQIMRDAVLKSVQE